MFGAAAFSVFAFAHFESALAIAEDAFADWLDRPAAARCWLLEVDALSLAAVDALTPAFGAAPFGVLAFGQASGAQAGGEVPQYWSTHGYTSHDGDVPERTWYAGRLVADQLRIERAVEAGGSSIGGLVRVYAEAILVNDDGGLDTIADGYALDGRAARVYLGPPDAAKSEFSLVFSGVVQDVAIGNTVRLGLADVGALLERFVNPSTYAGSGGTEGGDDLKGKQKPWCGGRVKGIAPPLVDSAGLVYQVSDGAISDVPAVYDRGISLTKVGGVPGAGEYSVNTTAGTFTLGATPDGTVTADVDGDATLTGFVTTVSAIVRRILLVRGGLVSGQIDPVTFDRFATEVSAVVGIWAGTEPVTCGNAIDELLATVGAVGGFSRAGAFKVARLALPTGAVAARYTAEQIGELARAPLPGAVEPVVWRATVGWQKNYTVQDDLADAVTAAQRTFASQPVRVAVEENLTTKSQRRLAVELGPGPGLYAAEADAETEVARLMDLWGVPRARFVVPLPLVAITRDIADIVELEHPRHGLALGRAGRVYGTKLVAGGVELEAIV